jgi:hypothetical protein
MHNYILKLDLDYFLPKQYLEQWRKSRIGLLYAIGFKVSFINISPSSKRGYHVWISIQSPRRLKAKEIIILQLICGSDPSREFINNARLRRKMPLKTSNKLFSKVIYRRAPDFERNRAYSIVKKIKSANDRENLKATLDRLFGLENHYRNIMKEGRKL